MFHCAQAKGLSLRKNRFELANKTQKLRSESPLRGFLI